jgi:hypothetical protein
VALRYQRAKTGSLFIHYIDQWALNRILLRLPSSLGSIQGSLPFGIHYIELVDQVGQVRAVVVGERNISSGDAFLPAEQNNFFAAHDGWLAAD